MATPKIDLIRQALTAAESSIKLARQLLNDLEKEEGRGKQRSKELPGVTGIFDGQNMTTEKGERYSVPENYASKSVLVVGDTLKLVEDSGEKRFKQIEHVKRHRTVGILTKKDGKWTVVTSEGSYRLLPAAVAHFEGDVGDEAAVQLPANNLQATWAGVEKIIKKAQREREEEKVPKKVMEGKAKELQITKPEEKHEKEERSEKPKDETRIRKEQETKEVKEKPVEPVEEKREDEGAKVATHEPAEDELR